DDLVTEVQTCALPISRAARVPRSLRCARGDRVAPVRHRIRFVRRAQPCDPAQRAELALAAALAAALRARDLSLLSRPGRDRWQEDRKSVVEGEVWVAG